MKILIASLILMSPHEALATQAHFEIPVILSTSQTPALSTDLKVGIGVGFTQFPLEFYSFRLGYGTLVTLSPLFWHGTKEVYTSGVDMELDCRAYLAYAFDGSVISFWPYVVLGPNANLKVTKINVFDESDRSYRMDYGFRGGGGIKVRFGDFDVKIESAAGFGSQGLSLRTTIMFGFGIF